MIEFDCSECQTHVIDIVGTLRPVPLKCSTCIWLPGWHKDPTLARILHYQPGERPIQEFPQ